MKEFVMKNLDAERIKHHESIEHLKDDMQLQKKISNNLIAYQEGQLKKKLGNLVK
jgi:hypothetical protein